MKLILIDIDGTLKNSKDNVTDKTKKSILRIKECGDEVVLCSARPRYYTAKISKEVGINNYYISSNGAEIYDNVNKQIIYSEFVDKETVKNVYDACRTYNVRCIFTTDNKEYATKFIRNDSQELITDNNFNQVFDSDIKQIMIIDENNIDEIEKYLVNKYSVNIADRSGNAKKERWFSIINNKCNKGNALKILSNLLKSNYTIAIGNDKNDISMILEADLGVCVGNADEDVKKISNLVIKSNDENGVSEFLDSLK